MPLNFFCDENITKQIVQIIATMGFPVDSVRNQNKIGISNGELVNYLNKHDYTLVTFDKDFLNPSFRIKAGIVIIDIHPNRNENVIPILTEFISLMKKNKINCYGKMIILNKQYLDGVNEKD